MITKKGFKRVHILRVLRCRLIPANNLLSEGVPLLNSPCSRILLSSLAPKLNLPIYFSDQIERIQKRAFKIMYHALRNEDALQESCCTRIRVRRHKLCLKTFKSIYSNVNSKLEHLLLKNRRECHGRCLRKSNSFILLIVIAKGIVLSVVFSPYYTNVFNT